MKLKDAYTKSSDEVIKELNSSVEGLNEKDASIRTEKYGLNEIENKKQKTILEMLIEQLKDRMILILLLASILSFILGEYAEGIVILIIIFINALISIIQEKKALDAIEALRSMNTHYTTVIREGKKKNILTKNVVVGDIVYLEDGNIVPADMRLMEENGLKVDESSLTGESVPVEKDAKSVLDENTTLADRTNMVYSSTIISYGTALGIVTATAKDTEVGSIATMLEDTDNIDTPLKRKLNKVGEILSIIGVIVAIFFWGMAYVFSQFIRLNGSPKFASLMFITSSLFNIILDYIFIAVLKFGISGAAWATAFSYIISFIIGFSYFFNPKCKIKIIKVYGGWNYIFKAILNGFSEFLSNISSGIIPWLFNITAYKILGNNGILIYSAANYIITFFIMIASDIGEILSSLISVSYGAKNKNKMKDFLKMGMIFVSSLSISASIILLINPSILVNALLKNLDSKTAEDAMFFVRASIPIFICVGINIIMSAYYTSIQKAGASALIAALRTLILPVLLVLTLPNILGFLGLVLVLPISEIITLIVSIALYKNRSIDVLIRD